MSDQVYRLRVIPWQDFQNGIAPLWKADQPQHIPIINNPYQIIQYPLDEWRDKICYFPVALMDQNQQPVAFTSIYNLSDSLTRIRGIYVLPEHRGKGVGHLIWQMATGLFPRTFYRTVGFWREDSAPRFIEHSQMKIVPQTDWIWSDFSQVNMRMLYLDHGPKPSEDDLERNRSFIKHHIGDYGLGGRNNLNQTWTPEEWAAFAEPQAYAYQPLGVDLDF